MENYLFLVTFLLIVAWATIHAYICRCSVCVCVRARHKLSPTQ